MSPLDNGAKCKCGVLGSIQRITDASTLDVSHPNSPVEKIPAPIIIPTKTNIINLRRLRHLATTRSWAEKSSPSLLPSSACTGNLACAPILVPPCVAQDIHHVCVVALVVLLYKLVGIEKSCVVCVSFLDYPQELSKHLVECSWLFKSIHVVTLLVHN